MQVPGREGGGVCGGGGGERGELYSVPNFSRQVKSSPRLLTIKDDKSHIHIHKNEKIEIPNQ